MKQFLITVMGVIVGGIILAILPIVFIMLIASLASSGSSSGIKEKSVLVMNLQNPITEMAVDDPFASFSSAMQGGEYAKPISTDQVKYIFEMAKDDAKIAGLHIKGASSETSYAVMKEILPYIIDFRNSGKFVYFYDSSIDQSSLYLASAADSIFVMPLGTVEVTGLTSLNLYYRNAMDKFGIDMQVVRHGKYKSAVEPYLGDHMSEASREQTQLYLNTIWNDVRTTIASARGVEPSAIDRYVDQLQIVRPDSAKNIGLIDGMIYEDQYICKLKDAVGISYDEKLPMVPIGDYLTSIGDRPESIFETTQLAVICAEGEIVDGQANGDYSQIYGETLAKTIRDARNDDNIKAIVMRVNSPGGSVVASEAIWREVELTARQKPFVVSMGQYAASGGYYISCAANHIFAEENTLTGSIGIFGTIPCLKKAVNSLGITTDMVSTHKEPAPSLLEPISPAYLAMFQNVIEEGYDTFITRCANGRNTTKDYIDSIGQGRVWAGADALPLGLVDEIGSLDDAIKYAAQMANIDEYSIKNLPKIDDPYTIMMKRLGMSARSFIGSTVLGGSYSEYEKFRNISSKPMVHARMEDAMIK